VLYKLAAQVSSKSKQHEFEQKRAEEEVGTAAQKLATQVCSRSHQNKLVPEVSTEVISISWEHKLADQGSGIRQQ
jgi:hypothetical protein